MSLSSAALGAAFLLSVIGLASGAGPPVDAEMSTFTTRAMPVGQVAATATATATAKVNAERLSSTRGIVATDASVAVPLWWPGLVTTLSLTHAFPTAVPTASLSSTPSPYQEGSVVVAWQWCDSLAAMREVVEAHAARGLEAATARWNALVEAHACHWIPPALATTALLVNRAHEANVTIRLDARTRPARVEIWLAAIDGVRPHGYVATLYPLPGEET